jgi:hypothetical protein
MPFAIEPGIKGLAPQERLRVRQGRSRPLIVELEAWFREQRADRGNWESSERWGSSKDKQRAIMRPN